MPKIGKGGVGARKRCRANVQPGTWVCEGRYMVDEKIGSGGYGVVFSAFCASEPKLVALKFAAGRLQPHRPQPPGLSGQLMGTDVYHASLEKERHAMKILSQLPGFPRALHFGKHENQAVLAMDLLGNNLHTEFTKRNSTFSLPTLLKIVDRLLVQVKLMHEAGIIHNDLKPANILIGRGPEDKNLYVVDFGLWGTWRVSKTEDHVKKGTGNPVGTVDYMSVNCHKLKRTSRRDDLVTLCYIMADFVHKGKLPWRKLESKCVGDMKTKYDGAQLFGMMALGDQASMESMKVFGDLLDYALKMRFDEEPKYEEYRNRFRQVGNRFGVKYKEHVFQLKVDF